jgi:large subunit ribosomal protein L24
MRKIRSGDTVLVVSGRNKGQQGKVRRNLIDRDRVVIEGVNIVKKHIRRGRARQAGIVEIEAPLHVSNVMLVCPSCKAATRVGVRTGDDGKNVRYCKKCDSTIPRPEAA